VLRNVFRHGFFSATVCAENVFSRNNRESGEDPERLPPL